MVGHFDYLLGAFLIFDDRKPPMPGPGPDAPPPPDPPAPPPEEHPASRPAWRTVPRGTRRIRKSRPDAPPPEPVAEPSRPSHASWIAWHREYRISLLCLTV